MQDVENQPAELSQSANARHNNNKVETDQNPSAGSRLMTWVKSTYSIAEILKIRKTKLEPKDGFTTPSFNNIERPLPVVNIFVYARVLIPLRLISWGTILFLAAYMFLGRIVDVAWWLLTLVVAVLHWKGIHGIGRLSIPTVRQLWSFQAWPQWAWEGVASRLLLPKGFSWAVWLWWYIYLLISDISDFEQNFLNAWSQQPVGNPTSHTSDEERPAQTNENTEIVDTNLNLDNIPDNEATPEASNMNHSIQQSVGNGDQHEGEVSESTIVDGSTPNLKGWVLIYVENEHLNVPILSNDISDSALLEQLNMFYEYMKVKRGLVEVIVPRYLLRIDCVEVEKRTQMAAKSTGTLDCGRGLLFFHNPKAAKERAITEKVQSLQSAQTYEGLEFVRRLDRTAISGVIMAPPVFSLMSIIVWLSVYLRKPTENDDKVDIQAIVTAAFTIATYLVTAGALVIALVAYLDSDPRKSEVSGKE